MNHLWRRAICPKFLLRAIKPELANNAVPTFIYQNQINTRRLSALQGKITFYTTIRNKSKKAQQESDDEDEEIITDDSSLSRDSKIVKMNTTSLRTDLILKQALNISRNKIEQQFYESKIRVNGKKILKKSTSVRVGDEIDIIKMVSPKNSDHLYVYRVEIMNITAKEESINITARRFKNLLIENYEIDPYKGHAESDTTS